MKDTKTKLSMLSISLHWITGFVLILGMSVGYMMVKNQDYSAYAIHKSVGLIIFPIILLRVIWRLWNNWPSPVHNNQLEQKLSKALHWILLIATVLFPLSGIIMSIAGGYGIALFGTELWPAEINPVSSPVAELASAVHTLLLWIVPAAIVLHVFLALKHHFIDKTITLKRMLGVKA